MGKPLRTSASSSATLAVMAPTVVGELNTEQAIPAGAAVSSRRQLVTYLPVVCFPTMAVPCT